MNERIIRAVYDDKTITVYQAFNRDIARSAIENQTFVSPPFKRGRMTWIKPSFLWMMYRSGWATKENQEHILAVKIKRLGFEWALKNSCLSRFDKAVHSSYTVWQDSLKNMPIRIQWDPEKDILLQTLNYRSIQIGLSNIAIDKYISDWIVSINDITQHCRQIHELINNNEIDQAKSLLPNEQIYPLPKSISLLINVYE